MRGRAKRPASWLDRAAEFGRLEKSPRSMTEIEPMATVISGVVKDGLIIPSTPLPEGVRVEILIAEAALDVPDELRAEFQAWDRSSADALALIERLPVEARPVRTS
jgi:hypothetical protein